MWATPGDKFKMTYAPGFEHAKLTILTEGVSGGEYGDTENFHIL